MTFALASLAACAGDNGDNGGAGDTGLEPPAAQAVAPRFPLPEPSLPEPSLPEPSLPEPGVVLGLSAGGVTALLGPPDYRRRDKPAEIWQYRNDACVLDIFLYSAEGAPVKVNHMDFRRPGTDKDKAGLSDGECFQGFVSRNRRD